MDPSAQTPDAAPEILVSACLAGRSCRYDGRSSRLQAVVDLVAAGRAVPVCPEEEGGLGTPREPAEILGGTGTDVLEGRARVIARSGRDLTEAFLAGARAALAAARAAGARRAILKEGSPSCGVRALARGGETVAGIGVTAALLRRAGITVEAGDPGPGSPPVERSDPSPARPGR